MFGWGSKSEPESPLPSLSESETLDAGPSDYSARSFPSVSEPPTAGGGDAELQVWDCNIQNHDNV